MPLYDHRCPDCGFMDEVVHGMNEKPTYECPKCGIHLKRVFNSFGVNLGGGGAKRRVEDHIKAELEMRQDLSENHGVEKFAPARGIGVKEVYRDVKASGSYVKDQMQAEAERANAKRKARQRDWMKGAQRRAPARSRETNERRAAEAAKNRAIRLSTP